MDCNSWNPQEGGRWLEIGSVMEGTGLYLTKRGCDDIASSFVTMKTNLFPSYCIIHAEDGMESSGSKLFSIRSPTCRTSNMGEKEMPVQM